MKRFLWSLLSAGLATAAAISTANAAEARPALPQSHPGPDRNFVSSGVRGDRAPAVDLGKAMPEGLTLTWLGFSGFRIVTPSGKVILIDPWTIHGPSTPEAFRNIEKADLILVTHAHRDHLGDSVEIAQKTGATVVAIYDLVHYLEKRGVKRFVRLNKGGSWEVDGIRITMVHASHSNVLLDGDEIRYAGEAAGFVIELDDGFTLYHAGDTDVFSDMALIGELYHPDLALLPIGGMYTMGPLGAARAVQLLGAKNVVPMHYGELGVLPGKHEELIARIRDPEVRVFPLERGTTYGRADFARKSN